MSSSIYVAPDSVGYENVPGPQEEITGNVAGTQDSRPCKMSSSIYTAPDPTQMVIYTKRRVHRAYTEDEVREEHVYDSVGYENVPGPQEEITGNVAGTQGQSSKTVRRPFRDVAVFLGMLGLILLVVFIGLVVHYKLAYEHMTLERKNILSKYDNLTLEYDNLTLERDLLECKLKKSCPSGWKKFGCSCYYRTTEDKTWQQSRVECLNEGADLVTINSAEEQAFIGGLRTGGVYGSWIGLNRTDRVTWTWVGGNPLTTKYWRRGWPRDDGDENCAVYWHPTGTWYNVICSVTALAICEK